MQRSRYLVIALLIPLLGLSWLLLAFLHPEGPSNQVEHVIIGYLLGTMFGQATMASAWTALGPGPLVWRLPLSLAWTALLVIAFLLNFAFQGHGGNVEVAIMMGGCLFGQWLLVQLPVWGLALYGLRLRHCSDPPESNRDRQFGIRQLMILTAIIAVVLGIARIVVGEAVVHWSGGDASESAIFVFLAGAGILMTLPLLVAGLLPRLAWIATGVVLALIAVGTWYELPLVMMVYSRGSGPNIWHLAFINAFQAAWVLAVVGLVRFSGYGIWHPEEELPVGALPMGGPRLPFLHRP